MKKIALFFALFFGLVLVNDLHAQKTGFVNVEAILVKVPEYQEAQTKLNELASQYKKEVEDLKTGIQKLQASYQADKILLSQEMRLKKEKEIETAQKRLETVTSKRFGENGDLFKERQKLVKPIQDRVHKAIKEVAEKKGFSLMLDVSSTLGILYYSEKYDKTQDVLKNLGYL